MTTPARIKTFTRNEPVTVAEMLATGATYRQIDHWVRQGWLLDDRGRGPALSPGHGAPRHYTGREHRIVTLAVRLTRAGLLASTAVPMARAVVDDEVTVHDLDGITIRIEDAS